MVFMVLLCRIQVNEVTFSFFGNVDLYENEDIDSF